MAWVTPSNRSQGELITAAIWNQDVVANAQYLYDNLGILDSKVAYSLLASSGTFSFTGLPQLYDGLLVVMVLRGTAAVVSTVLNIRLNNDTGTNYSTQRVYSAASTTTAAADSGSTSINVGGIPAASATSGMSGVYTAWIPGYRRTNFHKTMSIRGGGVNSSGDQEVVSAFSRWSSTNAINRIDVYPSSGNWATGSECAIFAMQST